MNSEVNIVEYHMVCEPSSFHFNYAITKKIKEGFVPYAAPFSASQENHAYLCQAMVKYAGKRN
jgi:hypothetical protein